MMGRSRPAKRRVIPVLGAMVMAGVARGNYDGFGRSASDNNTLDAVFGIAF